MGDKLLKHILLLAGVFQSAASYACDAEYSVKLQTLGQNVIVELRTGVPGSSRVVETKRSNGGSVDFSNLCPGGYFLAIGDNENVNVTPVRQFQNGVTYQSKITLKHGAGNVSKKNRSSL